MKILSFYLPQFHTFPENDEWWGKGFTEWTNTKKAKPLFDGHYQPHTPYNGDYYDLLNPSVMERQVKEAKEYGVYGFCFYHYWFTNGKMLMEKPVEHFLNSSSLDLNFCISWANEPWTRRWDGGSKKIIMPQEYGSEEDWIKHFNYLLPFFQDKRYIRIDGKPLILIYRPELIECLSDMIKVWRTLAEENGLNGLYVMAQGASYCRYISTRERNSNIDAYLMYEPGYTYCAFTKSDLKNLFKNAVIYDEFFKYYIIRKCISKVKNDLIKINTRPTNICDYDILWNAILKNKAYKDFFPGAFTGWDNSARRGASARIVVGSTPEKFEQYLNSLILRTRNEFKKDIIFINAWNEWAEGAHLEADEKYGYGYLEAVKNALIKTNEWEN